MAKLISMFSKITLTKLGSLGDRERGSGERGWGRRGKTDGGVGSSWGRVFFTVDGVTTFLPFLPCIVFDVPSGELASLRIILSMEGKLQSLINSQC